MRPYLLKGHERPLTQLRFNREGDLLLSCAKDKSPTLWFSEDGKRVGTYVGHNGTVWTADFTLDSTRLITGSADSSARLWDVETGESLFKFQFQEPCRAVDFSLGDDMAAISSDPFMAAPANIHIVRIEADISNQDATPVRTMSSDKSGRVSRVQFTDLNKTLLTSSEDGCLRRWDVEVGKMVEEKQTLKTYNTERPANSAAISPIYDHVLIGGGQEASQVTTTSSRAGGFTSRFFHKIFGEEFGTVRGHFGPINAVAFHPDGRSFTTGGEDGYVRLHHFDADYFSTRFLN
ncbi:hypothetical protein WJX84_002050 [Apatococcus fuscideae]|uniref:Eukaryotic translation initiation factor 3 subunit I n=1 Tax=Apatococcus fuscideae TaxID=2026836 RepID=A0AAW1T9F0_9CHLO